VVVHPAADLAPFAPIPPRDAHGQSPTGVDELAPGIQRGRSRSTRVIIVEGQRVDVVVERLAKGHEGIEAGELGEVYNELAAGVGDVSLNDKEALRFPIGVSVEESRIGRSAAFEILHPRPLPEGDAPLPLVKRGHNIRGKRAGKIHKPRKCRIEPVLALVSNKGLNRRRANRTLLIAWAECFSQRRSQRDPLIVEVELDGKLNIASCDECFRQGA
jgi:hypothetical protein